MGLDYDALSYIKELVDLSRRFPYDEVGAILAETVSKIFESKAFDTYIGRRKNMTYVKPDENVGSYPPFWNTEDTKKLCTKKTAQIASKNFLEEHPTIYLSCDGGLYSPTDSSGSIPAIQQSFVIQAPLLTKPVVTLKSTFMDPETTNEFSPSGSMTAGEFRFMQCMIERISGIEPECCRLGCPNKKCPIKKVDFKIYQEIIETKNARVVGFLDRPVCANYLRVFSRHNSKLVSLYRDLLETSQKNGVSLISVKQSSTHKALISQVIDFLAGRAHITNSFIMGPIAEFLKENPDFFDPSQITPEIASRYDVSDTKDFVLFLNDYWNRGFLKNILIDYSLFKHMIKGFEYRSNSFFLSDEFLKKAYKNTEFHFFYVNYNNNWGRVEYINSTPELAAKDYFIQTSASNYYYPLIITMAHEKAVIRKNFIKVAKRVMQQTGLSQPTLKTRSKGFV